MNIVNLITTGNLSEATSKFETIMAEKSILYLDSQKKFVAAKFGLNEGILDRFKKKQLDKNKEKILDSPAHQRERDRRIEQKRADRAGKIRSGSFMMESKKSAYERGLERDERRKLRNKIPLEIPPKAELDAMAAKRKARVVKPTGSFTGRLGVMWNKYLSNIPVDDTGGT